jgi:nucleosome assembly protein 1-like 1
MMRLSTSGRPWVLETITERDEVVLAHLVDITSCPLEGEQKGFVLDFHFTKNEFFSNAVISKTYHMIDDEDPILESAEGTEIQWLPGKNLCVKVGHCRLTL